MREAWHIARSARGPWRLSKTPALALALPARYFARLGAAESGGMIATSLHRTAVYVIRTHGGLGGGGREVFLYPDWVLAE